MTSADSKRLVDGIPLVDGIMTVRGADGRPYLLQSRCSSCGSLAFPPRERCAACSSPSLVVEEAPRDGRVYSWTTAPGIGSPQVVAMVELENGLMVQGQVTAMPGEVNIGAAVTLTLSALGVDSEGHPLVSYAFEAAGEALV